MVLWCVFVFRKTGSSEITSVEWWWISEGPYIEITHVMRTELAQIGIIHHYQQRSSSRWYIVFLCFLWCECKAIQVSKQIFNFISTPLCIISTTQILALLAFDAFPGIQHPQRSSKISRTVSAGVWGASSPFNLKEYRAKAFPRELDESAGIGSNKCFCFLIGDTTNYRTIAIFGVCGFK